MKQIVTGCKNKENTFLVQKLVDLLNGNMFVTCVAIYDCRKWLYGLPSTGGIPNMIPVVFLTFASLLPDHLEAEFKDTKLKELQLCTKIFKEKVLD